MELKLLPKLTTGVSFILFIYFYGVVQLTLISRRQIEAKKTPVRVERGATSVDLLPADDNEREKENGEFGFLL